MARKSRIDCDSNEFRNVIAQSKSIIDVIRHYGYKESGGMYHWMKLKFKQHNVDTSHFTGQLWSKGQTRETNKNIDKQAKKTEKRWGEVFCVGGTLDNRSMMKRLLLAKKIEYKCCECGLINWQQKPIRLQLDHINGDRSDCREKNLRLLCPNCHSQTPTHSKGKR